MQKPYKKTEKWWLGLTILFYALYNIPGYPAYGDSNAAIWHGILTIVPLWVIVYGGMAMLNKQRKLRRIPEQSKQVAGSNHDPMAKGGI
jgi:hypothetical protein